MRTVKEVAELTGISVRTLHYYDEIGLLKPTENSEAGYRLYDDKALEVLQRILFFREFDLPLKEIKAILQTPGFDERMILRQQRQMLEEKEKRIRRMIHSIDDILKGENAMDFKVFDQSEIEHMYQALAENLSEEQKETFIQKYGSMEQFREHFIEQANSPQAQENYQKLVELYGDKEQVMEAAENPQNPNIMEKFQLETKRIYQYLAANRTQEVSAPEIQKSVEEYEQAAKSGYQMEDVSTLLIEIAKLYCLDEKMMDAIDSEYGKGTAVFIGKAFLNYYKVNIS